MEKNKSIRRAIVAAQIKEAMERKGITRKQLAEAVRRQPSEVTKWLGGHHNFTIDLLAEISEALGVQITGVVGSENIVAGYNQEATKSGLLCEPAHLFDQTCSVGPIILPKDCFHNLERRAQKRGEDLMAYVKGLLLRESSRPTVKASTFCGIWSDEDFGMSIEEQIADIKTGRLNTRKTEEL